MHGNEREGGKEGRKGERKERGSKQERENREERKMHRILILSVHLTGCLYALYLTSLKPVFSSIK